MSDVIPVIIANMSPHRVRARSDESHAFSEGVEAVRQRLLKLDPVAASQLETRQV